MKISKLKYQIKTILLTLSVLLPVFLTGLSVNADIDPTDVLSGKKYELEDYTLLVYILKENIYDMSLHIDGSGDLKDKMLSIDLGSILLMANYETVYTELNPFNFKKDLTHTEPLKYSTRFNIKNNFTNNEYTNFTSERIENVSAFLTFTVTQYYNFPDYNETHDFLTAQLFYNIHSETQSANTMNYGGNDLTWLLVILVIAIFGSLYFILSMSKRKKIIYNKKVIIDDTIVKNFSELNSNNLMEIDEFLSKYEYNFDELSFPTLRDFQNRCKYYYETTLDYKYLLPDKRKELLLVKNNHFINIPSHGYKSLYEFKIEIKNLTTEIEELSRSIENDDIFSKSNALINDFIIDYKIFIEECRKYSKDFVFEKMENFQSLTISEFESFKNSFERISNKKYDYSITFEALFSIIVAIYLKPNAKLLNDIKDFSNKNKNLVKMNISLNNRNKEVLKFIKSVFDLKLILEYIDGFDKHAIYDSIEKGFFITKKDK